MAATYCMLMTNLPIPVNRCQVINDWMEKYGKSGGLYVPTRFTGASQQRPANRKLFTLHHQAMKRL